MLLLSVGVIYVYYSSHMGNWQSTNTHSNNSFPFTLLRIPFTVSSSGSPLLWAVQDPLCCEQFRIPFTVSSWGCPLLWAVEDPLYCEQFRIPFTVSSWGSPLLWAVEDPFQLYGNLTEHFSLPQVSDDDDDDAPQQQRKQLESQACVSQVTEQLKVSDINVVRNFGVHYF